MSIKTPLTAFSTYSYCPITLDRTNLNKIRLKGRVIKSVYYKKRLVLCTSKDENEVDSYEQPVTDFTLGNGGTADNEPYPYRDLSTPGRNISDWLISHEKKIQSKPEHKAWWRIDKNDTLNKSLNSSQNEALLSFQHLITQEEWMKHRDPWRYMRAIFHLLTGKSVVLRRTSINLLFFFAYTFAVCVWNTQMPKYVLQVNPLPFSILGAFISLLLVFRTNASYGRYQEARALTGQMVLHTRGFIRLAVVHLPNYAQRQRAVAYTAAFAWCLKARVRYNDNPEPMVRELLGRRESAALLEKTKPAFFILQELTKILASCEKTLPHYVALGMDQQLSHMDRVLGGCERIVSSPIPLSYSRHATRCVFLYLLGLPFAFWPVMGWATCPMSLLFAFVTMGIDETGSHIEEPFIILPLKALCQIVTATCRETLEMYG